jgi:hypothetical protein
MKEFPFCMEEKSPPFAYLGRPIDEKVENSPTWGMAWAVMYMSFCLPIPEYVCLCAEFSARREGTILRRILADWNALLQQESGNRLGVAYAEITELMARSLGLEAIDSGQIAQRVTILNGGAVILRERWHKTGSEIPISFVER